MQVDVMELQGGLLGWQIEKLAKTPPGAHTVSVRMGPFFRLKLETYEGGPVSGVLELTQPGACHNSLHHELQARQHNLPGRALYLRTSWIFQYMQLRHGSVMPVSTSLTTEVISRAGVASQLVLPLAFKSCPCLRSVA